MTIATQWRKCPRTGEVFEYNFSAQDKKVWCGGCGEAHVTASLPRATEAEYLADLTWTPPSTARKV